jgi:apolipoprotein N-acyltransferase
MPFKNTFPFLRDLDVGGGDFFPGTEFKVFTMRVNLKEREVKPGSQNDSLAGSEVKVAAVICFDSVFPHIVRQFVKRGARILTIITNDAWFGKTSGPYQHAQYAVLRAIENRVSIARSANTGISMFIDPSGRKHETIGLEKQAEITYELPVTDDTTFYTQHGEWLGILCLVVSLPVTIFGFVKKEQFSS